MLSYVNLNQEDLINRSPDHLAVFHMQILKHILAQSKITANKIKLLHISTFCQVSGLWWATRTARCVCGTSSRETPSTSLKVRVVASRWRKKSKVRPQCLGTFATFRLVNRSGRTPGGADLPGVQQGRFSGANRLCGRLRQAHQHRHRQGGNQRERAAHRKRC